MHILAVSKALPPHHYDQDALTSLLESVWADRLQYTSRIKRFHEAVKVRSRYLALPQEAYRKLSSFTEANNAYIEIGSSLGAQAVTSVLEASGLRAQDVDIIFFTTVTGLAVPTLDAKLVNRMGFRRDIKRVPLFGLGCVAGAAGVSRMHDYLKAYPKQVALLLSVELCSLTVQLKDVSVANLIATGLFGDGAAAVIGVGSEHEQVPQPGQQRPTVVATQSAFYYDSERVMGWDIGSDGFKLVLSDSVSRFVAEYLGRDIDTFLSQRKLSRHDIKTWVCHPGGPKILRSLAEALDLTPDDLALTWNSLSELGNLSSTSVLFILADTMATAPGRAGAYGMMLAMGPGFCSELVLLRW